MMKGILRICAVLTAVLAVGAALPLAHAQCSTVQYNLGPNFPSFTGSSDPDVVDVESAWWNINGGNPALLSGADNGSWTDDGNGGTLNMWLYNDVGSGLYMAGTPTNAGPIDGCPDRDNNNADISVDDIAVAVCDPAGNWAVGVGNHSSGSADYNIGSGAMLPTPGIHVTGSTHNNPGPNQTTVNFTVPALSAFSAAVYIDGSSTKTAGDVVKAARIYTKIVPRPGPGAGTDRRTATGGWVDSGVQVTLGGVPTAGSVVVTCASNSDSFIGIAPVFDGATPFRSGCVTPVPKYVQCGPTLAEPPGKFKIIDKPKPGQRNREN